MDVDEILPPQELLKAPPRDPLKCIVNDTASSFLIGSFFGALQANWGDVPKVIASRFGPAVARTGSIMLKRGLLFSGIGFMYTSVDCLSESLRGKSDWKNGFLGGMAAGSVVGLHRKSILSGFGAGVTFAVISSLVDATGESFQVTGDVLGDGAIPDKAPHAPTVRVD